MTTDHSPAASIFPTTAAPGAAVGSATGAAGLKRVQLADQVVDQLRTLIARGVLAKGARLPSEVALSRDLGVGRSTIREALKVLGHLGLIQTRPGSGSYVTGSVDEGRQDDEGDAGSGRDLAELFEFRLTLELEIAQLAAERRTNAQLAEVLRALEDLHGAAAVGDPAQVTAADLGFHRAVAAACGNRYLLAVYEQYQPFFEGGIAELVGMQASNHIADVHDDLAEALVARDIRGAATAVRRTFDEIRIRLKLLV